MHVDRARAAGVLLAPHAVEQQVARDDDAGVRHEVREQVELLRGELDGLAGDGDVVRLAVEHDVAERQLSSPCSCGSLRRRIAFMRATSSRGENGFVR